MHENDVITPGYTCNSHHDNSSGAIYRQTYRIRTPAAVDEEPKRSTGVKINDVLFFPHAIFFVWGRQKGINVTAALIPIYEYWYILYYKSRSVTKEFVIAS